MIDLDVQEELDGARADVLRALTTIAGVLKSPTHKEPDDGTDDLLEDCLLDLANALRQLGNLESDLAALHRLAGPAAEERSRTRSRLDVDIAEGRKAS